MPGETDPLVSSAKTNAEPPEVEIQPVLERIKDVVRVYWALGFFAFGGPSAHIGILRDHLVRVHKWLDEDVFMELFALGQGLPGPTSTQLVISTASTHGGALGGALAFIMWSLPGYIVMTLSGKYLYTFVDPSNPPMWLLGVPPAAMSLIFKASYGFVKSLDIFGVSIGIVACVVSILVNGDYNIPSNSTQVIYPILLIGGGLATYIDYSRENSIGTYVKKDPSDEESGKSKMSAEDQKMVNKIGLTVQDGLKYFFLWLFLLVGSVAAVKTGVAGEFVTLFESFFRIGSLIFGGGVVMIPMAQSEFVYEKGWLTDEQFFQGVGLVQSLPGPMFNFSAFIGALHGGFTGSVVGEIGLMGPGFILIFAILPIWANFRHILWFKAVLKGLNASAIGLIVGGCVFLYAKSVKCAADAMVFMLAGTLAGFYNLDAPFVILSGVIFGSVFSSLELGQKPY